MNDCDGTGQTLKDTRVAFEEAASAKVTRFRLEPQVRLRLSRTTFGLGVDEFTPETMGRAPTTSRFVRSPVSEISILERTFPKQTTSASVHA